MKHVTYINAGAGSGKTYTLTKILAEQLSAKDETGNSVIKPSQVILTTFTELAAAEFREKSRVQILEKGNFTAASQIDSAAIGTVHSVALQFIKKFWYLLDYGADIKTISERDEAFYMSQSLARIVSERDGTGNLKRQADLDNFRRFRDHFDISDSFGHPDYLFWQRYLNDIVEKMEYYEVDEVETSIKKSVDTMRTLYDQAPFTNEVKLYVQNFVRKYYKYVLTCTTQAAETQKPKLKAVMNHCEGIGDLLPLLGLTPAAQPRSIETNCPGFTDFVSQIESLSVSRSELDVMVPFVTSIFNLAKVWRDDYKAYKKRNHIISYNDMEQLFLKLLTEEQEVKDYVTANYKLVMVDEFQDSNPIQLKIFNLLSELVGQGGGHSYWVGDPKQAIYGFRGADTDLVNAVSRQFKFYPDSDIHPEEGENMLGSGRLTESWRSREQLVKLVNATFLKPFRDVDGVNKLCIELEPHFKEDTLKAPSIVHWECGRGNKTEVAEALANQVKELLASGLLVHKGRLDEPVAPISPKDVAILSRQNADIKIIVKALRKYGVPVSEPEDAIMQRIEVQLIVTLLQYIQNPSNKHVVADLMRMMCGKSTSEILKDRIQYVTDHYQNGAKWDEWMADDQTIQKLLDQTARFRHLSIPEMVRGLIYECNIPSLTAIWGDSHIRRQNLSTLQHLADDYDEMCVQMGLGTSINGFIYYLNSIEPDKEKDNKSNTVKVYTYHGAKGLEWPVVIMHGLETDALDIQKFIRRQFMKVREMELSDESTPSDPFKKRYYLHFYPNTLKSSSSGTPSALRDKICELDMFKTLQARAKSEERRLLYVGMTRAKDYLYTFGSGEGYNWLVNAGVESPSKNNIWGNTEYIPEYKDVTRPVDNSATKAPAEYQLPLKPEEQTAFDKRYLSPSKIESYDGYSSHFAWKESGTEIDHKGWGKDYATIGTCIHDIFAVYQPGQEAANRVSALNIIGGYGLTTQLAGHVDALLGQADWLYGILKERFPQSAGDVACTEYPFQMTLESGQTLRGEMDLLWFYTDATGRHCVLVDYKSFAGVDLHHHTATHYAQLSAYAAALQKSGIDVTHALIYYPVHAVIHELKKEKV